jgi:hypothetical protein
MSANFKLTQGGEVLEIQAYYDPDLEFEILNKDLAREQAECEFGYQPTAAVHFASSVRYRPSIFLLEYLEDTDISEEVEECRLLDFFILDAAEHTIRIYEDVAENGYLEDLLKLTRDALKTEDEDHAPRSELKNKGVLRKIQRRGLHAKVRTRASDRAAEAAIEALKCVIRPLVDLAEISYAAAGICFDASRAVNDAESQEYKSGRVDSFEEYVWQARHLIHMIEVMQNSGDFKGLRTP